MNEVEDTIVVFTARSPDRVIREGGSQAWVLNLRRARECGWVLCTQNRHNPDQNFSDATEPHGTAFLLGKIDAIRQADGEKDEDRWMIAISEFARLNIPAVWDGSRNPVRYTNLQSLGIDPQQLSFEKMPSRKPASSATAEHSAKGVSGLSIPEAKKALALTFGVSPEAVEITIRG